MHCTVSAAPSATCPSASTMRMSLLNRTSARRATRLVAAGEAAGLYAAEGGDPLVRDVAERQRDGARVGEARRSDRLLHADAHPEEAGDASDGLHDEERARVGALAARRAAHEQALVRRPRDGE